MQQFFIEDIKNPILNKNQLHQVKHVLRMRSGDKVRLVDDLGQGIIAAFSDDTLMSFEKIEDINFPRKSNKVKIIMSLIRNERLEWLIQKCAEVGVDEIVLYKADHGVVRDYKQKEARKLERFNQIALEASEQSYRQFPLRVLKVIDKKELEHEKLDLNFYADLNIKEHITDVIEKNKTMTAVIGPEGGFSNSEREKFKSLGFKPVSLGNQVLRAETAPIVLGAFVSLLDKELDI